MAWDDYRWYVTQLVTCNWPELRKPLGHCSRSRLCAKPIRDHTYLAKY